MYLVPTVSLLYLFCFIDRANIGKRTPRRYHKASVFLTVRARDRKRQNCRSGEGPQPEGLRLQCAPLHLLHLVYCLRNPVQHHVQVDWTRLVHPRHLTRLRCHLAVDRLRPQLCPGRRCPLCARRLRSRHDARHCLLLVSLVPPLRTHVPPVAVHRHGAHGWRFRWSPGFRHPHSRSFRRRARLAHDLCH